MICALLQHIINLLHATVITDVAFSALEEIKRIMIYDILV